MDFLLESKKLLQIIVPFKVYAASNKKVSDKKKDNIQGKYLNTSGLEKLWILYLIVYFICATYI